MTCSDANLKSELSKIAGVLQFVEDHDDPWALNSYKGLMALVSVSERRPGYIGPPPGPAVFYAGVGRKSSPGRPR